MCSIQDHLQNKDTHCLDRIDLLQVLLDALPGARSSVTGQSKCVSKFV